MRYLGLLRATPDSEAGVMPPAEMFEKMGAFMEEVVKAGVVQATDGLKPSSFGTRVHLADGKVTVIDGPFTESKELVASYAIFNVESKEQAIYWTQRFLEVLGSGECELRPIFEPEDFPPELFTPDAALQEAAWREEMGRTAGQSQA